MNYLLNTVAIAIAGTSAVTAPGTVARGSGSRDIETPQVVDTGPGAVALSLTVGRCL